jgi:hypothetical protein
MKKVFARLATDLLYQGHLRIINEPRKLGYVNSAST